VSAAEQGASHAELCELLDTYAELLGSPSLRYPTRSEIQAALGGFVDTLGNLHSEPGDDRDVLTLAEHRREIGMCPDGGDHWYADCGPHECPTWREAAYEDHMADTGRLR
jgi:hypothetical protein